MQIHRRNLEILILKVMGVVRELKSSELKTGRLGNKGLLAVKSKKI